MAEYRCNACGYEWDRRFKRFRGRFRPKSCPNCKSRTWDVEMKRRGK